MKKFKKKFTITTFLLIILSLTASISLARFVTSVILSGNINTTIQGYCKANGITNFKECLIRSDSQTNLFEAKDIIAERSESIQSIDKPLDNIEPIYLYTPKIDYVTNDNCQSIDNEEDRIACYNSTTNNVRSYSNKNIYYFSTEEPMFNQTTGKYELTNAFVKYLKDIEFPSNQPEENKFYYTCYSNNTSCDIVYKLYYAYTPSDDDSYSYIKSEKVSTYNISTTSIDNSGLYIYPDDYTDKNNLTSDTDYSYLYRGDVKNNWVLFGGFYWRIIRINGNGSIRLIYSGTSANHETSGIVSNAYNSVPNYTNVYGGYMYDDSVIEYNDFAVGRLRYVDSELYYFTSFDSANCDNSTQKCTLYGYYTKDENGNINYRTVVKANVYNNKDIAISGDELSNNVPYKYSCYTNSGIVENTEPDEEGKYNFSISCKIVREIVSEAYGLYSNIVYHGYLNMDVNRSVYNTNNSNAKTIIDSWYENNIYGKVDNDNNNLEKYISNEIFCNDRNFLDNSNVSFEARRRVETLKTASLICNDSKISGHEDANRFTLKSSGGLSTIKGTEGFGNNALDYPVALITADEVALAGGTTNLMNYKYYLYTGSPFFTMTPGGIGQDNNNIYNYLSIVASNGTMTNLASTGYYGIRPVINLSKDVIYLDGDGTESNPYKVTINTKGTGNAIDVLESTGELIKDETVDKNLRYQGQKPDNYVRFNNELWRIIGIFNVDDGNGNIQKRIKIVKDDNIGNYKFNNISKNDFTNSNAKNILNDYYYYGNSIECISDDGTTCPISKLNDKAKSLIDSAVWNLGAVDLDNSYSGIDLYNAERSNVVPTGNNTTWTGYVGLIYPSDFVYASQAVTCKDDSRNSICGSNNYLKKIYSFTMTPSLTDSGKVLDVQSSGVIGTVPVHYGSRWHITPAVYLKNDVKIIAGNGTSNSPYILDNNVKTTNITFDSDNGLLNSNYKEVIFGEKYGYLPTPSKEGYLFEGWYTAKSGGTLVDANNIVEKAENHTLYAHYKENSYNFKLYLQGGTVTDYDGWTLSEDGKYLTKIIKHSELNNVLAPIVTKEDKQFMGYFTTSDSSDMKYIFTGLETVNSRYAFYYPADIVEYNGFKLNLEDIGYHIYGKFIVNKGKEVSSSPYFDFSDVSLDKSDYNSKYKGNGVFEYYFDLILEKKFFYDDHRIYSYRFLDVNGAVPSEITTSYFARNGEQYYDASGNFIEPYELKENIVLYAFYR